MKRSKKGLHAELMEVLEANLRTLKAAHAATLAGATHDEAKAENDKDTRALEQSYLARGQAMRVEALRAGVAAAAAMNLAATQVARVGALLEAEGEDGEAVAYLLAPEGGGTRLSGGVQVVTPASPLGAALVGKRAGDELELKVGGKTRVLSVVKVS